MGQLLDHIRSLVDWRKYVVGKHAAERLEERGILGGKRRGHSYSLRQVDMQPPICHDPRLTSIPFNRAWLGVAYSCPRPHAVLAP